MKSSIIQRIIIAINIFILPISFTICIFVGEVEVFDVAGMIRYIWIMLLFIPIPLFSFLLGLYLRKNKRLEFRTMIFVSIICLILLSIIGSYRFIFSDIIYYDDSNIEIIEQKLSIDLPSNLEITNEKYDDYVLIHAQIKDIEEKKLFENRLLCNEYWYDYINSTIKGELPSSQHTLQHCDYYLIFNETTNSFTYDSFVEGQYDLIIIGYDINKSRFIIISDYVINIVK